MECCHNFIKKKQHTLTLFLAIPRYMWEWLLVFCALFLG